mgnify:CR=1 FL=1
MPHDPAQRRLVERGSVIGNAFSRDEIAEFIQRRLLEDRVPTYVIGEVREGEPGVEWLE